MPASLIQVLSNGTNKLLRSVNASTGVSDAGKLAELGTTGILSHSLMPYQFWQSAQLPIVLSGTTTLTVPFNISSKSRITYFLQCVAASQTYVIGDYTQPVSGVSSTFVPGTNQLFLLIGVQVAIIAKGNRTQGNLTTTAWRIYVNLEQPIE